MNKKVLIEALKGGRNSILKEMFIEMINQSDNIRNVDGKIEMFAQIYPESKNNAYALATWDQNEYCSALITHDLSSFSCMDVGAMIQKLRLF